MKTSSIGHPGRLRTDQGDEPSASGPEYLGRRAELVQQPENGRVLHARAQNPFQVRMDLREQAPQPVGQASRFGGEVVVEADEYLQLGDRLVIEVDRPQRVGHGPGGVGDDERVLRVGLGLAGVEVGDPPHGRPGR